MSIALVMRLLHILSAVALGGGLIAWKFGAKGEVADAAAAAWRPLAIFAAAGVLISGMYAAATVGHVPSIYHILLGVKVLLALHVIASTILALKPNNPKRARQIAGAAWAAILVVVLAVLLRFAPGFVS